MTQLLGEEGRGRIAVSLLCIAPLFFLYELGLLLTPAKNGVDFFSPWLFELLGGSSKNFALLFSSLLLLYLFYLVHLSKERGIRSEELQTLVLESAIYALSMGTLIVFVMDGLMGLELLPASIASSVEEGLGQSAIFRELIGALGAGVWEEIIFRLGLMGLFAVGAMYFGVRQSLAWLAAALVSALFFSLAHHWGSHGEIFHWSVFAYRCIAGLFFAAIFYYRSLAHAVYTHVLYDIYIAIIS